MVLSTQYLLPPTPTHFRLAVASVLLLTTALPLLAAPPTLSSFYPAGGQRGQTVSVTATGEFPAWPVQVWADRPGITATCGKEKGKLELGIAPDAAAGVIWLRVYDGEGASALRPFVVGTLPEVVETEPNDAPDKPQAVASKVVANGKLAKAGDVDAYRLALRQGETLVAAVQANALLGSPMDGILQVCELSSRPTSASGQRQVEAFVVQQNNDAVGLDPLTVFTASRDGDYLVRLFAYPAVPNSGIGFAGAETFVYRLTLTTGGYAEHALPLAASTSETTVRLGGFNIAPDSATVTLPAVGGENDPLSPPDEPLVRAFHPELAGAVFLPRIDRASVLAADGAGPDAPQELTLPTTVTGLLETAGDVDSFTIPGKKAQKIRVRVESRSRGFATDLVLTAFDETGAQLAEIDDGGRDLRDPQLIVTPKADGRVRIDVRDLHRRGGPRMVYRLTAEAVAPDFGLSLAADALVLAAGKPLEIPVAIDRRDGFAEKIELSVVGLPAGITAEPAASEPKGDTAKMVKLVLKAAEDAALPTSGPIRIEGRSTGASPLVRSARFSTGLPLAERHFAAWLTAKK